MRFDRWPNRLITLENTILLFCLATAGLFLAGLLVLNRAFWLDEAVMGNLVQLPFNQLWPKAVWEVRPFFYLLTTKLWALLLGDGEFSLRAYSAAAALTIIGALYQTAASVFQDKKVGLLAAFLGATSYFLLWFGAQARPYTLAPLLGLLSYHFLFRSIKDTTKKNLGTYLLFTTLGTYTHHWLTLVFLAQALYLWLVWEKIPQFRRLLWAWLLTALFAVPGWLTAFQQSRLGTNLWLGRPTIGEFFSSINYLLYGGSWFYLGVSGLALALVLRQKIPLKTNSVPQPLLALGLYLLVPLTGAFLASQFIPLFQAGRYEIVILPAVLLALAYAWSQTLPTSLLFLTIPVLLGLCSRQVLLEREKVLSYQTDDRQVIQQLAAQIKPNETVIATDLTVATVKYYLKETTYHTYPEEMRQHTGWFNLEQRLGQQAKYQLEAEKLVASLRHQQNQTVYLIDQKNSPTNPLLIGALEKEYTLTEKIIPPEPRENSWISRILVYRLVTP